MQESEARPVWAFSLEVETMSDYKNELFQNLVLYNCLVNAVVAQGDSKESVAKLSNFIFAEFCCYHELGLVSEEDFREMDKVLHCADVGKRGAFAKMLAFRQRCFRTSEL